MFTYKRTQYTLKEKKGEFTKLLIKNIVEILYL